jgi:hypothetical protein
VSAELAVSLSLQVTAVVLLVVALRRRLFAHLGALFVLAMVAYHGVTELVQLTFHSDFGFRSHVVQRDLDRWHLLVGPAILLFTVVYLATLGSTRKDVAKEDPEEKARALRFLDWRLVALLVLPLLLLTVRGAGFSAQEASQGVGGKNYAAAGLSAQYLVLGIALVGYGLVVRSQGRWFVRVLIGASIVCALTGQRSLIAFTAVLMVFALARYGISPSRRQVRWALALIAVGALIVSSARIHSGRETFAAGGGAGERAGALAAATLKVADRETRQELADDYVYRLDGNFYPAQLLNDLREGGTPVGVTTLRNGLALAVPSFLNPAKLSTDIQTRDEKYFISTRFGLNPKIDYLPTQLGTILGYFGPVGLYGGAILMALMFGLADRWLKKGHGPIRLVVAMGLLICVLSYEGTMSVYPITLRGIVLLVGLTGAAQFMALVVRRAKRGRRHMAPIVTLPTPS